MEWLIISIVVVVVLVLAATTFIINKGKKIARLEDGPAKVKGRSDEAEPNARSATATATLPKPSVETPPADDAANAPTGEKPSGDTTVDGTTSAPTDTDTTAPPSSAIPTSAEPVEDIVVPDSPAELVELEQPPSTKKRMGRLRDRLARSNSAFGRGLLAVISKEQLDEDDWEDLEDNLLQADVGVAATTHIVEQLRTKSKVLGTASPDQLRNLLADELVEALSPEMDRTVRSKSTDGKPAIVMVVGVNGTGKTTTCGKLARVLVGDGNTVLMGAADTFRAAAADQLQTWGERVGVDVIRGPEQADPASVAFDAVKEGISRNVDTVLIDTAGRLHTKIGLMDELGKVGRVIAKHKPIEETLLVLDATTGQNGVVQAKVFTEVVDITGVVLTKLDGSAKGGIVISVQRELGVPVKLVGLGEGKDDLAPFDPREFVEGLLANG
ncbi:fused signal recognition particle receptor [Antricoccus suffuscus]|uniref:Signal recognition particle receptor FtsY n=1 Tax=Antricoccus suffuscus TaxID=1629062 RepID=A0A2T1A4I8_9ACTN|nr:signal recognition particle-docking protein FtsY [Antricoccus suffuscus]PRZ43516.1 fused signal recognition particle receptor [Antricoccus suffuscus]